LHAIVTLYDGKLIGTFGKDVSRNFAGFLGRLKYSGGGGVATPPFTMIQQGTTNEQTGDAWRVADFGIDLSTSIPTGSYNTPASVSGVTVISY
jgi:hypothetical protein